MANAIFVRQEAVLRMALDTAVKVEGEDVGSSASQRATL